MQRHSLPKQFTAFGHSVRTKTRWILNKLAKETPSFCSDIFCILLSFMNSLPTIIYFAHNALQECTRDLSHRKRNSLKVSIKEGLKYPQSPNRHPVNKKFPLKLSHIEFICPLLWAPKVPQNDHKLAHDTLKTFILTQKKVGEPEIQMKK